MYPFKNLAFAGAGVRNVGYAGTLEVLEEAGALEQIAAVAGTSSGAIVATMLSVGYGSKEIRQQMLELDFQKLTDGGLLIGIWDLVTSFGFHRGDYFLHRMEEVIARKTGDGRTTFAEARRKGCKALHVVGANLSTRRARIFSESDTPKMAIADAVRISMSLPLFFRAKRYDGDVYVDGGVILNYPIDVFGGPSGNAVETLGMHMGIEPESRRFPVYTLRDYAEALFASVLATQNEDLRLSPEDTMRTIRIADLGIAPAQFGITREQKLALMEEGSKAGRAFLADFARRRGTPGSGGGVGVTAA